ncbi:hypothetical protein I0C86_06445 [Plantactinospora sp. S1510]|uniref:Uncharacterized protein n=1 Tax=Plantactinospora alkalitolerans TaxID=2789879 RepID=A0ABS0GR02_9ACTN|nr:hypothetical protein [Plantactinospora alkalitolerans]MBF9128629.1 hypothetical protein [Plantactinospora alkalitolerans]
MLLHQCWFGLGPAVFIRENRWSAPRPLSAVMLTKWMWGNPPTLVKV